MSTETKGVKHSAALEAFVLVTINDQDVTERITNPVRGEEWRGQFYRLFTAEDVIQHLAYNCLNGYERVNQLEGWADLPDDAATMAIEGVEPGEVITQEPTDD